MSRMDSPSQSPPSPAPSDDVKRRLATPVEFIRGVGPGRAELLERLGLRTANHLLFNFPRDYQDLSDERKIDQLEEGQLQSVRGVVAEVAATSSGFGKSRLAVLISDGTGHLRALWYKPAVHARSISRRSDRPAHRDAEDEGADVGDVAPRSSPRWPTRRRRSKRSSCRSTASPKGCRSITCGGLSSWRSRSSPISWKKSSRRRC
jgi:hypothetical protein